MTGMCGATVNAIAACHVRFGRKHAGFSVSRSLVPPLDLAVVQEGLKGPPLEPPEQWFSNSGLFADTCSRATPRGLRGDTLQITF